MTETFRDSPYAASLFRRIVGDAHRNNRFYHRWISDPENVPILDRGTYLDHNDEILNGHPVSGSTSGSTGVPIKFSHSPEWVAHALKDSARFVASLGGQVPGVQIVNAHHYRDPGPRVMHVSSPADEQIQFILSGHRDHQAVAITTYPTNAEILSRRVLDRGLDMRFITRFGMYGEAVEPHHRAIILEAFPNARIWTTYSSKEFGLIAMMCPHHNEYHHIMAHRLGVEVLRDDGHPAENGEQGEVVVTDFFNRRSPFIRFRIGDLATRGECPCGRIRLPALSSIVGKVRGALVHRNGNRIAYVDLHVALRGTAGLRQCQVIQDDIEDFTVKVVAKNDVEAAVRRAFLDHFGYVPERLRIEHVGEVPRGENGKYHFSVCNI
jgi:phenylacetate-coenzyme A ligase PaaK-like adenylate-forming protein